MSSLPEPPIEIDSGAGNDRATVIWMQGLGADGSDFVPIVPELKLPAAQVPRFIFPHAPVRAITINGGMAMRGWYDITSLEIGARGDDEAGIRQSGDQINTLIEREIERGVDSDKIVLAGFSQGGVMALYAGLTCQYPLGGVIALSCYLPTFTSFADELTSANGEIDIFMAHGQLDEVVRYAWGEASRDRLTERGYAVQWHTYPIGHAVCAEEITAIGRWLEPRLPNPAA